MKLIRYGEAGHECPGVIDKNGNRLSISPFGEDYDEAFFENNGLNRLEKWLENNEENCPEISREERLGPPVKKPSKIICVGLNYVQHAIESGMEVPEEPVLFFKSTTALCGPNDALVIPKGGEKADWEVELAVVVGKRASYVSEQEAMRHIAGYVLHNDYSERTFQLEKGGQWVKGKSCDTFAPLGPFLATKNEIPDPHKLHLWLDVNGERMQDGDTSDMIFSIPFLVSYISQYMTLLPGDIISTGTPFGVGLGLQPPRYLKANDVVKLGIEGLGSSRQVVKNYREKK